MMKKYLTSMLFLTLLIVVATLSVPAFAEEGSATSNAEESSAATNSDILFQKIVADKKLLVASNMDLTDEEAKGFWPIYEAYQQELHQINQRMAEVINEYALAYNKGAVLNETAKKLIDEALAIEQAEVDLKKSYVPKLSKVLPDAKVARYIQIENKIRAVVRYDLVDAIPLMH
jgi:hypothetical protein